LKYSLWTSTNYYLLPSISSDVSAFFDKVNSDPALKAKAKAIGTLDFSRVQAFAKELGFTFTANDMHDHLAKQLGDSSDLNEDDDLSSVAGGGVSTTAVIATAVAVGFTSSVTSVTSTTQGSGW